MGWLPWHNMTFPSKYNTPGLETPCQPVYLALNLAGGGTVYKNKQSRKVICHLAGLATPASVGTLPVIRYLRTGSGLVPPAPVVRTLTQHQTLNALNAGQCQPEQGEQSGT